MQSSNGGGNGTSSGSGGSGSGGQGQGTGTGGSGGSIGSTGAGSAADQDGGTPPAVSGHNGRGCGLGTSCTAVSDLAAPAAADGYQLVTPPNAFTVQPGQEIFPNYCFTLTNTTEFDVGKVQSWMTPGSSHDLFVYRGGTPAAGSAGGCSLGADQWFFAASIPGVMVELKMPDGVGMPMPAGTQIILSAHFVNTGTTTEQPQIKLNLFRAQNFQYTVGAMVSFNTSIDVPAATATGPGTQTVMGTCSAPAGASFFAIGTHTNSRATTGDVNFVSGGTTTNIVHTTDWQNPDVGVWTAPQFLTVQSRGLVHLRLRVLQYQRYAGDRRGDLTRTRCA